MNKPSSPNTNRTLPFFRRNCCYLNPSALHRSFPTISTIRPGTPKKLHLPGNLYLLVATATADSLVNMKLQLCHLFGSTTAHHYYVPQDPTCLTQGEKDTFRKQGPRCVYVGRCLTLVLPLLICFSGFTEQRSSQAQESTSSVKIFHSALTALRLLMTT